MFPPGSIINDKILCFPKICGFNLDIVLNDDNNKTKFCNKLLLTIYTLPYRGDHERIKMVEIAPWDMNAFFCIR